MYFNPVEKSCYTADNYISENTLCNQKYKHVTFSLCY